CRAHRSGTRAPMPSPTRARLRWASTPNASCARSPATTSHTSPTSAAAVSSKERTLFAFLSGKRAGIRWHLYQLDGPKPAPLGESGPLQAQFGAGAGQRIDHRVHDRARGADQIGHRDDAHPAQPLAELRRAIARRGWKSDPCTRNPHPANQRAIGLTAKRRRVAVRTPGDALPSAPARLDDPVLRIGCAAG